MSHQEEIFRRFIASQRNLKTFKLDVQNDATLMKNLVFCVLENCQNLRKLSMGCDFDVELSSAESAHLIKSITSLKSLEFPHHFSVAPSTSLSPSSLALNKLRFTNCSTADSFFCTLLAGCQKMKHLRCDHPSNATLQQIFENMVNFTLLNRN